MYFWLTCWFLTLTGMALRSRRAMPAPIVVPLPYDGRPLRR